MYIVTPQYFFICSKSFFAIPRKEIPSLKATAYCTAVAFFGVCSVKNKFFTRKFVLESTNSQVEKGACLLYG